MSSDIVSLLVTPIPIDQQQQQMTQEILAVIWILFLVILLLLALIVVLLLILCRSRLSSFSSRYSFRHLHPPDEAREKHHYARVPTSDR